MNIEGMGKSRDYNGSHKGKKHSDERFGPPSEEKGQEKDHPDPED